MKHIYMKYVFDVYESTVIRDVSHSNFILIRDSSICPSLLSFITFHRMSHFYRIIFSDKFFNRFIMESSLTKILKKIIIVFFSTRIAS